MQVHALFFARLKREFGVDRAAVDLPSGATVRELARALEADRGVSLKGCMVAVNDTYAQPAQVLEPGDEVAFLPPVAGGMDLTSPVSCEMTDAVLDLNVAASFLVRPDCGAQAYFVGTVRSPNGGKQVEYIDYEGFGPLAEQVMQGAATTAQHQYGPLRVFIQHRTGRLHPAEASILIGVASPHRRAALEACDFIIEYLKVHIPVWKYEQNEDGTHWVEGVTGHPTL